MSIGTEIYGLIGNLEQRDPSARSCFNQDALLKLLVSEVADLEAQLAAQGDVHRVPPEEALIGEVVEALELVILLTPQKLGANLERLCFWCGADASRLHDPACPHVHVVDALALLRKAGWA